MAREKQAEDDYREFIELLNKNKVECLIIGAYSVIFHTKIPRETKDIDFWIKKTPENAEKCTKAIYDFCDLKIDKKELLSDKEIFFIGEEPNRIDIFNKQKGLTFDEAFAHKKIGVSKGIGAYFISKNDLIKLKEYFLRSRDSKDLKRLKKTMP
jgi:hypothetical protein